jgi:hypothetical protein
LVEQSLNAPRVVTGVDGEGRSSVLSDERLPISGMSELLWSALPEPLPAWALELPHEQVAGNQPAPGSTRLSLIELPPLEEYRRRLAAHPVAGMDERGFDTTRTIDHVYVLTGPI